MTDTTASAASARPTPGSKGPTPDGQWYVPLVEAVGLLPLSERTLRGHCDTGEMPHHRVGGRLYLAWPDDFRAFFEATQSGRTA